MMTKRLGIFSLLFFTVLLIAESCVNHDFPQYTCGPDPVSYSEDVNAIVMNRCAVSGCHNGDNGDDKNWTDFSLFQSKSETARAYVIDRIMPPDGATPLTQEEVNTIACWVDQGSQNN